MSIYFSKSGDHRRHRCFNLDRYRDKHGKFYEIRRTPLPRGKVWRKLASLEWTASHNRMMRKAHEIAESIAELKSGSGVKFG